MFDHLLQIADSGIEVPDWKVTTEAKASPVANLELWRPFMDRVDYVNFPWTEFKAVKAKFLNEERSRWAKVVKAAGIEPQ